MASRLRLRKKNYPPPLQEPPSQPMMESKKKTSEDNTTIKKMYAQAARKSSQIDTSSLSSSMPSNKQAYIESEIFIRAIESAKKHKINLKPGRKDRGYGNCVFEAVINNINDRVCFSEKLFQSPNWYRWCWMNEMMERLITCMCFWNPGYSIEQLREGFGKIKESGIYDIDFFGDMMIVGIACGIKKKILIFNTNENLVHDPISIVDPTQYDPTIKIDNETPVLVAYNNYHYENLHPEGENDRQKQ